jgi:hypothetical protein
VAVFVAVTFTPGNTAPVGSSIVPLIRPLPDWASKVALNIPHRNTTAAMPRFLLMVCSFDRLLVEIEKTGGTLLADYALCNKFSCATTR